jgi:hypothetical protein
MKNAFFAYPAEPHAISISVADAVKQLNAGDQLTVTPWESLSIVGFKVDRLIRERLLDADFLIADISRSQTLMCIMKLGFVSALKSRLFQP